MTPWSQIFLQMFGQRPQWLQLHIAGGKSVSTGPFSWEFV